MFAVGPYPHIQCIAAWNALWDLKVEGLGFWRAVGPLVQTVTKEESCCLPPEDDCVDAGVNDLICPRWRCVRLSALYGNLREISMSRGESAGQLGDD